MDPFAGSYMVESMTDAVEAAARELMTRIEDMGGAVEAIERGFQKGEIEHSAYDVALSAEDGRRTVIGVNKFQIDQDEHYDPLRVDPQIEKEQAARLEALRAERDGAAVTRHMDAIRDAAQGSDNVLYPLRDALRARATVGEVCNALRDVWGAYQPDERF